MNTYRGNGRGKGGRITTARKIKRKRNRKKKQFFASNPYIKWGLMILAVLTIVLAVRGVTSPGSMYVDVDASEPDIDVQLLDVNPYSRPGIESDGITGIVIHYTCSIRRRLRRAAISL